MKLPPGIRRRKHVWQVYAKVHGKFVSKSLPLSTELGPLKEARRRLINRAKYGLPDEDEEGGKTFAQDAAEYLKLVKHMPSYDDREYEIKEWAKAFAGRLRAGITSRDIRAVLERWRKTGRADGTGGLAVSSLNRRRTALMSLWTTLDGKSGVNPVRDVPEYDESQNEQIRAFDPRVLYRVIARVGRRKVNKGVKTRARLRLMLWTGWPQAQIMRLKREHLDLMRERAFIVGRRKGKGTKNVTIPLLPGAIVAAKAFIAADAFGTFSTSAMHSAFARAVERENESRARKGLAPLEGCYPYTLRHTFGTEIAKRLTDERAIQELMLHATPLLTRRYTEAATAQRVVDAMRHLRPA